MTWRLLRCLARYCVKRSAILNPKFDMNDDIAGIKISRDSFAALSQTCCSTIQRVSICSVLSPVSEKDLKFDPELLYVGRACEVICIAPLFAIIACSFPALAHEHPHENP
jgi:hypothetical protein